MSYSTSPSDNVVTFTATFPPTIDHASGGGPVCSDVLLNCTSNHTEKVTKPHTIYDFYQVILLYSLLHLKII